MAISSETSEISYSGNGSTVTSYAVPFRFVEAAHLTVTVTTSAGVKTTLAPTSGFVATGAGNESGSIVTVAAVPGTSTLNIARSVPFTQPNVYSEGGALPPKTIEKNFDLIVMMVQRIWRAIPVLAWVNITGKPTTFAPGAHTHDDRYYTETEIDGLLGVAITGTATLYGQVLYGQVQTLTAPQQTQARTNIGAAAAIHAHAIADVTGLVTDLATKANEASLNATNLTTGTVPFARLVNTQTVGNADATIAAGVRDILQISLLSGPRNYTLPLASAYPAGSRVSFSDMANTLTGTNTATLTRSGTDLINGLASLVLNTAGASPILISDGVGKWNVDVRGISRGGTGAITAAGARTMLGIDTAITAANARPSLTLIFQGDSTVGPETGTRGTLEPGSTHPFFAYPSPPNPENWAEQIKGQFQSVTRLSYANLGTGGTPLSQINTNFATVTAPSIPATGDVIFTLVGGHNDINALGQTGAQVYASATAIRAKVLAINPSAKCVFVPPVWHAPNAVQIRALTDLAVADLANWHAVIDQGYSAGFNLPWDTVHQNWIGNSALKNRWLAQVIERRTLLLGDVLTCGSGGLFPTVEAALSWSDVRRTDTTRPVRIFRVIGDIRSDNTDGTYGDGRWTTTKAGYNLRIEITEGSRLYAQRGVAWQGADAAIAPISIEITGEGSLIFQTPDAQNINFGSRRAKISVKTLDCSAQLFGPFAQPLEFSGKRILAGPLPSAANSPYAGTLYSDGVYWAIIGPGTTVFQANATCIINSRNGAAKGIIILPGCHFIRSDGGSVARTTTEIDTPTGRIHFYGPALVSNDTKYAGHTWGGTAPTVVPLADN